MAHAHAPEGASKSVALLISVLALCLALVETGAKSAQTDVITRNVEVANLWAYFQARTIRQTVVRAAADQLQIDLGNATDPATRTAIEAQQRTWRDTAERWETEPREGRRDLSARAQEQEHLRQHSLARYHAFEYSAALIQVAIVIASASIVTSVPLLAWLGLVFGLGGLVLGGIGMLSPEMLHF